MRRPGTDHLGCRAAVIPVTFGFMRRKARAAELNYAFIAGIEMTRTMRL